MRPREVEGIEKPFDSGEITPYDLPLELVQERQL
jgi:hypothetical protein